MGAWFDFWVTRKKECLTKSEILRAIAKSYGLELDEVETMRLLLDHCWDECRLTEAVTKSCFCSGFSDLFTNHLWEMWGPGLGRRIPSTQAEHDSTVDGVDRTSAPQASASSPDGASMRQAALDHVQPHWPQGRGRLQRRRSQGERRRMAVDHGAGAMVMVQVHNGRRSRLQRRRLQENDHSDGRDDQGFHERRMAEANHDFGLATAAAS